MPTGYVTNNIEAADQIGHGPFVTVVVPVRNEEPFLGDTLDALLSQDCPSDRFEVLVVDGESTDRTREVAGEYAERDQRVHLLSNPSRLSSAARNIGVRNARGNIILVVDGHCEIPNKQMLTNLLQAFETSDADCVGRPQPLTVSGATTLQRAIAAARSSWLGHHPDSFIYSSEPQFAPAASVAVAYKRGVFERVGYFDERFDACEDYEFNTRVDAAGLRCYFTPAIAVHYQPRNSLRGLFRQLVRYGRGRMRLSRKHPHTISVKTYLPALFIGGCVLGFASAWLWKPSAVVYLAVLAMYASVVLATSATIAMKHRSVSMFLLLPFVFLTIHFAAGTGLLIEMLRPMRRSASKEVDEQLEDNEQHKPLSADN